jgi:hypothetical protein
MRGGGSLTQRGGASGVAADAGAADAHFAPDDAIVDFSFANGDRDRAMSGDRAASQQPAASPGGAHLQLLHVGGATTGATTTTTTSDRGGGAPGHSRKNSAHSATGSATGWGYVGRGSTAGDSHTSGGGCSGDSSGDDATSSRSLSAVPHRLKPEGGGGGALKRVNSRDHIHDAMHTIPGLHKRGLELPMSRRLAFRKVRSIQHWSPYGRVGVVNADP